jgi:hypothetical protein
MICGVLLKKRKTHPFCIQVTVKWAQNRTHSKNSKAKKARLSYGAKINEWNCD